MEKKTVKYTKNELKKMKGNTHWAKLVHEEKTETHKERSPKKVRG